jgi:hypothetical protein
MRRPVKMRMMALALLMTSLGCATSALQNIQRHMVVGQTGCPEDAITISNERQISNSTIRLFDVSCKEHQFRCSSSAPGGDPSQGISCHEAL